MPITTNGQTTHTGLVLRTYKDEHCVSDYWAELFAEVWNPTTNAPETVKYGTDMGANYIMTCSATVDATPDVIEAFKDWEDEQFARTPHKGKEVQIHSGKYAGDDGVVTWYGDNKFGAGKRVGVKINGKVVFMNAKHVDVKDPVVEARPDFADTWNAALDRTRARYED